MCTEDNLTLQPILTEENYLKIITASLEKIKKDYFIVKSYPKPTGFHRERVFCYELYHQMRLLHYDTGEIKINGEIDKRGNTDFPERAFNPDFIFHEPMTHANNKIVIEVKGTMNYDKDKYGKTAIEKDFTTILYFLTRKEIRYTTGVFILYRYNMKQFQRKYKEILKRLISSYDNKNIFIITIKTPHNTPECINVCDWL